MKFVWVVFSLSMLLMACGSAKKLQTMQTAISKVDTTPIIVITENNQVDLASLIRDVYNKVIKNKIDFTTFSAKVHIDYSTPDDKGDATAFIRLQKDFVIWLSLRGALGIEGARVLITKDSVKVLNQIKNTVQIRGIEYLQQITDLPLDFFALQDLVIGNPIFIDSNIVSYNVNSNNELLVLMGGRFFKHLVTLNSADYTVQHSRLDDVNATSNRTADISYSNYQLVTGVPFATLREISVVTQFALSVGLDFKQYSFNVPVTFPFNPADYKQL